MRSEGCSLGLREVGGASGEGCHERALVLVRKAAVGWDLAGTAGVLCVRYRSKQLVVDGRFFLLNPWYDFRYMTSTS